MTIKRENVKGFIAWAVVDSNTDYEFIECNSYKQAVGFILTWSNDD